MKFHNRWGHMNKKLQPRLIQRFWTQPTNLPSQRAGRSKP